MVRNAGRILILLPRHALFGTHITYQKLLLLIWIFATRYGYSWWVARVYYLELTMLQLMSISRMMSSRQNDSFETIGFENGPGPTEA